MTDRQRRWLTAVLVLGAIVLAMVADRATSATVFFAFGDVILVFFLAWLLAFILSPVVAGLTRLVPVLPRIGAVVLVYATLVGAIVLVVVLVAGALAQSITAFVPSVPTSAATCPSSSPRGRTGSTALGLDQVDLVAQATSFLDNLATYAAQLAGPVQQLAVASLGALGNLLLVLILSLYMVVDRDAILSFFFRVVPPGHEGGGAAARDERRPLVRRLPPRPGDPRRRLRRGRRGRPAPCSACRTSRSRRPRPAS